MIANKRLPSMVDGLEYIKSRKLPVDFVVDVGILTCTYPLLKCFPDKKHALIEPVRSFHENIKSIYDRHGIQYQLYGFAAGSKEDLLKLCEYGNIDGITVSHSRIFRSINEAPTRNLLNCTDISVRTLDEIVPLFMEQEGIPLDGVSYLLKIDVDGTEEDILSGATKVLKQCSVVLLEVPIVKLLKRVALLDNLGFECVDIVDPCYYKGSLSQVDCIFVKKGMIGRYSINPWLSATPIDLTQWYEGRYTHVPS